MKIVIAVDGMGGEHGPEAVIPGIKLAYEELNNENLHFLIYAPKGKVSTLYEKHKLHRFATIRNINDVVNDEAHPLEIFKKGTDTTMGRAIRSVASGRADAVVSSGSTGGYVALCYRILGRMEVVNKIALPAVLPRDNGQAVMLDVGANLNVTADNLVQFSIMGSLFAKEILGIEQPRIGLLNVGTEEVKGLPQVIEAHKILKARNEFYRGFVEGTDIFKDTVDVIVTDGFSGNISLKSMEGVSVFLNNGLKRYLSGNLFRKILSLGALSNLKLFKKTIDRRQYNGAMLLGISRVAVKSHGDADDVAFSAALKVAYKAVKSNLIERISANLKKEVSIHEQKAL